MPNPQQPELRRSGHGATDDDSTKGRAGLDGAVPPGSGAAGPVPEDNLPGHHPSHEQDKPVERFRRRAVRVAREAEEEALRVEETTVAASGMTFDALQAGPDDGEGVLLLHGFPQTSESWVPTMEMLAAHGYRSLAPDQRGYSAGARPQGVRSYRIDELVADALALAEAQGWDRFHLVGHDWGGVVGWALAARCPERLISLTVVSTPHPRALAGSLLRSPQLLRSAYIPFFLTPWLPETTLSTAGGLLLRTLLTRSGLPGDTAKRYAAAMAEPGALTAALNWYRAFGLSGTGIGPVTVPTLYVWGDHDVALGGAAARATGEQVRGDYRFEVLAGAGHWLPETRSADLGRLLLDHVGGHAAQPGAS